MERRFFTDRLARHGLEIVLPEPADQPEVNRIIYDELVHGKVLDRSRRTVVSLLDGLWDRGAQGVVLGCTELELLIHQADCELPVLPCTTLHVEAALERAFDG
jgi:aspartate/glutamate racemase